MAAPPPPRGSSRARPHRRRSPGDLPLGRARAAKSGGSSRSPLALPSVSRRRSPLLPRVRDASSELRADRQRLFAACLLLPRLQLELREWAAQGVCCGGRAKLLLARRHPSPRPSRRFHPGALSVDVGTSRRLPTLSVSLSCFARALMPRSDVSAVLSGVLMLTTRSAAVRRVGRDAR
jgi:hypothetical protein